MRQEFSAKVKVAAFERAGGHCENKTCGAKLYTGKFRYDHVIPDWMGGPNTLDNCKVTCLACDRVKTARDQQNIAKTRRVRARHLGAVSSRNPLPCGKRSPFKKKLTGEVVRR